MDEITCPFCDEEIEIDELPFKIDNNHNDKELKIRPIGEIKLNFSVFAHLSEEHTYFDFMDYVIKNK